MKTYIVTGAGTGMGKATAELLARDKANQLVIISRTKANIDAVLEGLENREQHIGAAFDIRDPQGWKNLFAQHADRITSIEGLFANAGVGGANHYGATDRWDEIISINLTGTYVSIQECLPYLRKSISSFKHILITSSCLARFGVPAYTAYCTAKTGLLGLTRSLAVELGSEKILVNALCPGWVETDMARAGIQLLANAIGQEYQKTFDEQMSIVPLQRITQPEEVAQFVKFMFSDLQTSITGQGLDINNGSYMI
jgi:NAD(P)-dependent dehydrogenase (short-subunit alcohol dehydrogenase family)